MYIFWSLLGLQKSLGHTQIGLFLGLNSKFPTSIRTPFICGVHPSGPPVKPPTEPPISLTIVLHDEIMMKVFYSVRDSVQLVISTSFQNKSCKSYVVVALQLSPTFRKLYTFVFPEFRFNIELTKRHSTLLVPDSVHEVGVNRQ